MMLQPRMRYPQRTIDHSISSLAASLTALTLSSTHPSTTFRRRATHAAQGRANGSGDSAGRRLGAKKSASEYVIPGNIIFKQRGTKWHPGENVGLGKDHTIYAKEYGYVCYYQDPRRHPKRRYIGVALEREGPASILPTPPHEPTRRRLGMVAIPIQRHSTSGPSDTALWLDSHLSADSKTATPINPTSEVGATGMTNVPPPPPPPPTSGRSRYDLHRETNWSIGRTAERKGITVREFDRSDRWLAWRKRSQNIKRNALLKALKDKRKSKKKKVKRKVVVEED